MKKFIISLFIIGSFISCSQDKKPQLRPAYLFFKLGSTPGEVLKEIRSLESTGGLTRREDDYYWTSELDGQVYHYAPVFTFTPGDSLCSEMKLLYFDQVETMQSDLFAVKRNEVPMNLMCYDLTRVKSGRLRNKIVDNITSEQGPYTSRDTLDFSENLLELTTWKDRDGVDIIVSYRFAKDQLAATPFAGNSALTVAYSQTNNK